MSELPEGWPKTEAARPFFPDGWLRGKGWPSFERAVSALIKPASETSWRRIVDPDGKREDIGAYRDPPMHPRAFAARKPTAPHDGAPSATAAPTPAPAAVQ